MEAYQRGMGNSAYQEQGAATGSEFALVDQHGQTNMSNQVQMGNDNSSSVYQNGNGNVSNTLQLGTNNTTIVNQSGGGH